MCFYLFHLLVSSSLLCLVVCFEFASANLFHLVGLVCLLDLICLSGCFMPFMEADTFILQSVKCLSHLNGPQV